MNPRHTNPEIAAARAIATIAHRHQKDKIGAPYIDHPRRVAERLSDPEDVAAAWLHDVIEDCGISAQDLRDAGISADVVDAVVLLTRPTAGANDSAEDTSAANDTYYRAIREHPTALAVKLADIADNTDGARTSQLDPTARARLAAKYQHAREILGSPA